MKSFIFSVPVLAFFGLLSSAAPLLQLAGPPLPTTAPLANERPLLMAYYPDWASYSLPPEKIDFTRFDWIDFAFGLPDKSFALTWDDPVNAPALLQRLVTSAHDAGRYVKLSIGGWTGSQHFSAAVATEESRKEFSSTISDAYTRFSLDGIDIDWEYPGQQGNAGNGVSPSDTSNFLLFLQLLRRVLPQSAKITAATQTVPFAGSNGIPLQDVSEFAKVLDWVVLMNYDVWGSSSNPGPNAPLEDGCKNSSIPSATAHSAVLAWKAAGFASSQLVLGVPAYAYISRSTASTLRQKRTVAASRNVRVLNDAGGFESGQVRFRDLIKQGALVRTNRVFESSSSASGTDDGFGNSPGQEIDDSDCAGAEDDEDDVQELTFSLSPAGGLMVNPVDGDRSSAGSLVSTPPPPNVFTVASFEGAGGFSRLWDVCSSTPFLRSESAQQIITFDDPQSLGLKAAWVKEAGILGVNVFDVHGDTDDWDLVDSLRRGLGII
ncbi:glycoside hydrolase family 18 protein [Thelephora terrestris]|uniref:Glycoside hydrolase family 18 protein n=1 Tax=Thelephora terrestris TaxID=56493 RepID=A0A9P6HAK5_9AGAM|nr:glycoside hydrolase family 18 protein [Thelephora terrestris]